MTSNDNNNLNQPSSMFSEIMKQQATKQVKDSDTQFEESMNRGDGIFKQTTHISEIKDENQNMELNSKQNERQIRGNTVPHKFEALHLMSTRKQMYR